MKKIFILLAFSFSTVFFAQKSESLEFSLPEKYNLHLEQKQENEQMILMEYIPKGQNWDNYDIIVTKMTLKGLSKAPLQTIVDFQKNTAEKKTKNLRIKELSKGEKEANEYILFTMEADAYIDSKITESQVYFIIKGKKDVFICIAAVKEAQLSEKFVEEWSKVFMQSQIIK